MSENTSAAIAYAAIAAVLIAVVCGVVHGCEVNTRQEQETYRECVKSHPPLECRTLNAVGR